MSEHGDRKSVGETNVQRLLSEAYRPEQPDSAFAERVTRAMLAEAERRQNTTTAPRTRLVWHGAVWVTAAVLLIALGAGLGHYFSRPELPGGDSPIRFAEGGTDAAPSPHLAASWPVATALSPRPRAEAPPTPKLAVGDSARTGPTERRRVELPDGSVLYLNRDTSLTLTSSRHIQLDQGEIYLEVASRHEADTEDEANRFVVMTADREVVSLGTKFNVRAEGRGTSVAVTQGKVQVSGVDGPLQAGQQVLETGAEPVPIGQAFHLIDWTRDLVAASQSPLVPASNYAGGALVARRPGGDEASLSMRRYKVDVHIEDGFARTTIDQTYFNHESWRLEGTFFFPLPPDASLSRLAMYVGGKLMEGGMAEREHARKTFESIVRKQKDPALLEWIDGSTFRMRVFPLEPRQEKRIVLSYTQRLERLGDRVEYRFPGGHSMAKVGQWSCHVRAKDREGCRWEADSYDFHAGREEQDLLLDATAEDVSPDRNVVLRFWDRTSENKRADAGPQFVSAEHEGQRYLALRYPFQPGGGRKMRRDWVFLYETSADRDPVLARVQVDVIKTLLENAERDDTFTILAASSRIRAMSEVPLPVRPKNVRRAIEFLEKSQLVGALDLEKAFGAAAAAARDVENPCVVHLGSGYPRLGEEDQVALARLLPEKSTYVGVAVGNRWNRALMKRLAGDSGGYLTQINPNEPVAWRAIELASRLNAPRLTNVRVVDNREKLHFLNMSDVVCEGEELLAVARMDAGAKLPKWVDVTGRMDGEPYTERVPVGQVSEGAEYLPRTWSKLEIDRLVAEDALAHHDEIVNLSMAMYVMSPFTSLLVLENDAMYEQYHVDRGRKDHWALYPCPETIEVVHEPLPSSPPAPPKPAVAGPSVEEVLATILLRHGRSWLDVASIGGEGERGKINANTVTWDIPNAWEWGFWDVDHDGDVTVGLSGPGMFSADLDIPFTGYEWQDVPQGITLPGTADSDGLFSVFEISARRSARVSDWGEDAFRGSFYLPKVYPVADMVIPLPQSEFVFGVRPANRFHELVERETYRVVEQAHRASKSDLEGSIYNLKQQIETVRQLTELGPRHSEHLLGLLQTAVGEAMGRQQAEERRQRSQSERIAAARDREQKLLESLQKADKVRQLMNRFDSLMAESRYRFAEEPAIEMGTDSGIGVPAGIARTLQSRTIEELNREMVLRFERQKGVVDRLYITELAHVPFPDEPPILYPPAEVWRELTERRREGYLSMDLASPFSSERQIRAALAEKTFVDFDAEPLRGVVRFWEDYHDIRIKIAEDCLRRAGISPDAKISKHIEGISLRSAMRLVLGDLDLTYVQGNGGLIIMPTRDAWCFQHRVRRSSFGPPAIHNLLAYAPGVQTTAADVLAVVDAEAALEDKPTVGRIDKRARQLIESARRDGWQRLVGGENAEREVSVVYDGEGHFRIDTETALGLKETISCDGQNLWHQYPELGVGTRRPTCRFYGNAARALVPWLLPSPEELALGADVTAIDDRTVAITAHRAGEDQGAAMQLRLLFASDGRLCERQLLEADSEKVLWRETYDAEGTVRLVDGDGKERFSRRIVTEPCDAPELTPDPSLVVLAMPWRTREHVFASRGLTDDGARKEWSDEDALAVLAAETATRAESILSTIGWHFFAKGDRRPGFYTLLLASGVDWKAPPDAEPNDVRRLFTPQESTAKELIVEYAEAVKDVDPLAGTGVMVGMRPMGGMGSMTDSGEDVKAEASSDARREKIGPLNGSEDGFLRRLAELHDLWIKWQAYAAKKTTAQELADLERETVRLLKLDARSPVIMSALAAVNQNAGRQSLVRIGDELKAPFREHGPAMFSWRLLHAEAVVQTGEAARGRQLFTALVDDMVAAGVVPLISSRMKETFFPDFDSRNAWQGVVDRLTDEALTNMSATAGLPLALRLYQLDARDEAERIFAKATTSISPDDPGPGTLACVAYLWQTDQRHRADRMLTGLLADERYRGMPILWRLASEFAQRQNLPRRAAQCLDRALEIEFAQLPDEIDPSAIESDYAKLLTFFDWAAADGLRSDPQAQASEISQIVAAADRWRKLDPESQVVYCLAGRTLARCGALDLAWDYVVSPLAKEGTSIDWMQEGDEYRKKGQPELAVRAYDLAAVADPANGELCWKRALALAEAGRHAEIREIREIRGHNTSY